MAEVDGLGAALNERATVARVDRQRIWQLKSRQNPENSDDIRKVDFKVSSEHDKVREGDLVINPDGTIQPIFRDDGGDGS